MKSKAKLVIAIFGITGLISAMLECSLLALVENLIIDLDMLGWAYVLFINPSTFFTMVVFAVGTALWKMKVISFPVKARNLCWSLLASIIAFPGGLLTLFAVAGTLSIWTGAHDLMFLFALIAGGFALMVFSWISIRCLVGAFPPRFWRTSATTVFGALLATSMFNVVRAAFDAGVYYGLKVNTFTTLIMEEFLGMRSLLIVGQIAVATALGFWLVKTPSVSVLDS